MKKEVKVFIILACVFVANVILAEFIGVKIFSLEQTLGYKPLEYQWFGIPLSLSYTAGVIIWPVVFVLTDIINDFYGKKGVRFLTYLAAAITIYAFLVINIAIHLHPASWWQTIQADKGVPDADLAYKFIFGQGQNIIIGSLTAFILGQFIDIYVFQAIKRRSKNNNNLWIRATVSTLISQFIDSFVVIFIAFYIGQNWTLQKVLSVSINNYIYKGLVALLMIPILQWIHTLIQNYIGKETSDLMKEKALNNEHFL